MPRHIQIWDALARYRPVRTHVVLNKITGEGRGFAFVDFESVQDATEALRAFENSPMVVDHQAVTLAYADNNRQQRFPSHPDSSGGARDTLPDWLCDQCNSNNFARRTSCFQCHAPKSPFAMEMPHSRPEHARAARDRRAPSWGQYRDAYTPSSAHAGRPPRVDDECNEPSNVLAVRMIPLDASEGELQVAFASFAGVHDFRLIRDRETNESRGFAFVEFDNVESATNALNASSSILVHGVSLRVGFARDTYRKRSHTRPPPSAVPMNPIAAAALEQAQWSFSSGYGQPQLQPNEEASSQIQEPGVEDVDALLNSAAAEARPHVEEPKKPWPLPFETGGGMYVYVNERGLYYDTDSMFYYDPQSKLYYNQFQGKYFSCLDGSKGAKATFTPFTPPVPIDNSEVGAAPATAPLQAKSSSGIALVLPKKTSKLKPISFGLKPIAAMSSRPSAVFAASSDVAAMGAVLTPPTAPKALAPTVRGAAAASASMKKKSAMDIAKWSQRQRESKFAAEQEEKQQSSGSLSTPTPNIPANAITTSSSTVNNADSLLVPLEAPICLLCRRKFASMEQLHKHESKSKLHAENLAKAKQDKAVVAAQQHEQDENDKSQQKSKRQRVAPPNSTTTTESAPVAADKPLQSLADGFGGKMMKMMGWTQGALGKRGTGITEPIAAIGNAGHDTTGLGARTTPAVDLSGATSRRDGLQRLARARYEAANKSS